MSNENKNIMTTKEVAEYLGVCVNTVYRYVHEEGLPVLRFPGRASSSSEKT